VTPVPDVDVRLRERAFGLPGVVRGDTVVSVPGTDALCVADDVAIVRPDLVHAREFGHIHPDGSLHITLPETRAQEVERLGWGEPPPDGHRARHPGRVLLYTPTDPDESEVVIGLILESLALVVGQPLERPTNEPMTHPIDR
jgi:phospholipase/carboxylesterase